MVCDGLHWDYVQIFITDNPWNEIHPTSVSTPKTRSFHTATLITPTKIRVFGGTHGSDFLEDAWDYDLGTF